VEYAMMALRLREGLSLARFRRLAGQDFAPDRVADLVEDGLVWIRDSRLGTTAAGQPLLNAVLAKLLT